MNPELNDRLTKLEQKLDQLQKTTEQMRRYFQISMWLTIVFFVLPLIILMFVLPAALSSLTTGAEQMEALEGLL